MYVPMRTSRFDAWLESLINQETAPLESAGVIVNGEIVQTTKEN